MNPARWKTKNKGKVTPRGDIGKARLTSKEMSEFA